MVLICSRNKIQKNRKLHIAAPQIAYFLNEINIKIVFGVSTKKNEKRSYVQKLLFTFAKKTMIMEANITTFILFFTSFFTIINPFGVMPVYLTMTGELTQKERQKTARKATLVAFLTLIAFAFSGSLLFDFFGISINSFRVVGGIIFFLVGFDMLQARFVKTKIQEEEIKAYVDDISITPLAIPMITGPGAIANAIVLMGDSDTVALQAMLVGSIIAVGALTYLVLWGASGITKFLGETGNKVLMRLMGLIVMVIAVEFFFAGLKPIIQDIFNIH